MNANKVHRLQKPSRWQLARSSLHGADSDCASSLSSSSLRVRSAGEPGAPPPAADRRSSSAGRLACAVPPSASLTRAVINFDRRAQLAGRPVPRARAGRAAQQFGFRSPGGGGPERCRGERCGTVLGRMAAAGGGSSAVRDPWWTPRAT